MSNHFRCRLEDLMMQLLGFWFNPQFHLQIVRALIIHGFGSWVPNPHSVQKGDLGMPLLLDEYGDLTLEVQTVAI